MKSKRVLEERIDWFVRLNANGNRWLYRVEKRGSIVNGTKTACYVTKYADIDRQGNISIVDSKVVDQLVYRKRKGVMIEVSDKDIWDIIMEQGKDLTMSQRQKDFDELRAYFDKPVEDDEPRWCSPRDTTASGDIWIPFSDIELRGYIKSFGGEEEAIEEEVIEETEPIVLEEDKFNMVENVDTFIDELVREVEETANDAIADIENLMNKVEGLKTRTNEIVENIMNNLKQ